VDVVKNGIARNVKNPSPLGENLKASPKEGAYFNDYCNWTKIEEFGEFVNKSPAASIAGQLMKSSLW
jgi:hypothetical protein